MGQDSYLPREKSGQSVIDQNLPYRFLRGQPLKAWVLVQPWELNAPPSTLQSRALQTELVLPRFENKMKQKDLQDCQSTESGG